VTSSLMQAIIATQATPIAAGLRAEVLPPVASGAVRPLIWRQLPLSERPRRMQAPHHDTGAVQWRRLTPLSS
jgi:hypothetical protein